MSLTAIGGLPKHLTAAPESFGNCHLLGYSLDPMHYNPIWTGYMLALVVLWAIDAWRRK